MTLLNRELVNCLMIFGLPAICVTKKKQNRGDDAVEDRRVIEQRERWDPQRVDEQSDQARRDDDSVKAPFLPKGPA